MAGNMEVFSCPDIIMSPPGIPLVYELDADLKPVKHYYVASEEQVKAAMDKVAAQGKAK